MLRDRSPLGIAPPFDLHFLGTSQAFVLSQDQTLHEWYSKDTNDREIELDDVMSG